jgi:drug/metabolite transporter (DMT)-like permease
MANKEVLQKKIERLERYARFYQNMLLAILSGIVWSIYALFEKKVGIDIMVLSGVGVVSAVFIVLKIHSIDYQQDQLLEKLEKEE